MAEALRQQEHSVLRSAPQALSEVLARQTIDAIPREVVRSGEFVPSLFQYEQGLLSLPSKGSL